MSSADIDKLKCDIITPVKIQSANSATIFSGVVVVVVVRRFYNPRTSDMNSSDFIVAGHITVESA